MFRAAADTANLTSALDAAEAFDSYDPSLPQAVRNALLAAVRRAGADPMLADPLLLNASGLAASLPAC